MSDYTPLSEQWTWYLFPLAFAACGVGITGVALAAWLDGEGLAWLGVAVFGAAATLFILSMGIIKFAEKFL